MNSKSFLPIENEPDAPAIKQHAELLRRIELLSAEIQQLRAANFELTTKLHGVTLENQVERDFRRTALNSMEDADRARKQSVATDKQLQDCIADRLELEKALHVSQSCLRSGQNELDQLNAKFESRVVERTQNLQDRETRMAELAVEMKRSGQREKKHFARLLHDHMQPLLIAAKMRAELLAGELNGEQHETLMAIISILGDALDSTRNLAVQLSPPLLHDEGLPAALSWLASRMTDQHGLTIETQIDERANPDTEEERDILFQAAQEFVLNAAKHARIKHLQLNLAWTATLILLQVCDRGSGFDVVKTEKNRGSFGLLQLRQRLASIGGRLEIETTIGQGTQASAIVPLKSCVE